MSPSLVRRLGVASGCVLIAAAARGRQPTMIEFSVDIGSDSEMSDPQPEPIFDNVLDPGDVYLWQAPPLPFPYDGFRDDRLIFGMDPAPTPLAGTVVPVGMGGIGMYPDFFDMDGHDQLDFETLQYFPPDMIPFVPIPFFESPCVHMFTFGLISFNDDDRPGWPVADVPIGMRSPYGMNVYGLTPLQDEIFEIDVAMPFLPSPIAVMYGVSDEREIHLNMSPNPNVNGDAADDDVDSLDAFFEEGACPFWYWTCDHEATWWDPATGAALDPGHIYLTLPFMPGVVTKAIDAQIHLGLQPLTDVDAFEFAWLEDGPLRQLVLGIVFSVDVDDPLTPQDESGGLDPRMLYYSTFQGWNLPALTQPLDDDVDALALWREPTPPTERCDGDADGDGDVDFDDLNVVLANWGTAVYRGTDGDTDGSGFVDFNDLNLVLGNWGRVC